MFTMYKMHRPVSTANPEFEEPALPEKSELLARPAKGRGR